MFKNILVGFDGSEGSKKALAMAASLNKVSQDSKLMIAFIYSQSADLTNDQSNFLNPSGDFATYVDGSQMQPVVFSQYNSNTNDTFQGAYNSLEAIEEYVKQYIDDLSLNARYQVLEGNAEKLIPQLAEEIAADLVVVGNSGNSGIQKFFLGSISEKIAKDTYCPVLIAK